jgi:tetratricopeptide (TPR) repeat protein
MRDPAEVAQLSTELKASRLKDGWPMNLFKRWFWPRSNRSEMLSFYKKGMACAEKDDSQGAMSAYTTAIEHAGASEDVKAMALYNRALLFAAEGNNDRALADLTAVMEIPLPLYEIKLAARRRLERLRHRLTATARVKPTSAP